MKEKHYVYLAGLIDGDGCINASVAESNNQKWYRLHISINSVNPKVIKRLEQLFGGKGSKRIRPHYKQGFIWEWRLILKQSVKNLLENVAPFLVIKQPQAEIGIEFLKLSGSCPEKRESMIRDIQKLNQSQENNLPLKDFGKSNWIYLAGVFDAEGTFTVRKDYLDNGIHYGIWARLGNTNKRLITWLETFFVTSAKTIEDDKSYYWPLPYGAKEKEQFILNLLPYLVTKKEQAKVLLEYIRLNGVQNPDKREELYKRCFELNHPETLAVT